MMTKDVKAQQPKGGSIMDIAEVNSTISVKVQGGVAKPRPQK